MKASFLALLCVSVLIVTDAAAEINAAVPAQPESSAATAVVSAASGASPNWFKRKKRRPAYRRLRSHRR